jgi:hypothetical protein
MRIISVTTFVLALAATETLGARNWLSKAGMTTATTAVPICPVPNLAFVVKKKADQGYSQFIIDGMKQS